MFEINCPFCDSKLYSNVIDSIEEVKGQWECFNCNTKFLIEFIEKGGKE